MTRALCSAFALLVLGAASRAEAQAKPPVPAAGPGAPATAPQPPAAPVPQPPPELPPAPPPAPDAGVDLGEPPGPYYLEQPGEAGPRPGAEAPRVSGTLQVVEPPAPGTAPLFIFEPPPPPPPPRHVAPNTSLWLGGRLGWFIPFGSIFARTVRQGSLLEQRGVPWRDYATSGPMFELDLGARLSRNYNLFALWERAELGAGRGDGGSLNATTTTGGDSDFWAVGVRASSDADRLGFLSEIALGYRRARSEWDDGTTLELTQGLFEARLGFGADIRVNPKFSLSPMLTFGVGLFGQVELVDEGGRAVDLISPDDDLDGHGWFSLQLGGHFDLRGGR